MSEANEAALVQAAAAGDTAAFGELVQRYQRPIFNVALRLLGEWSAAEDATQETFLRAFRAFHTFDVTRPLHPWLRQICVNVCRNWFAAQKVRPFLPVSDMGASAGTRGMDDWAVPQPSPEQSVADAEQARRIRHALAQLPPHYRIVIELRHFGHLSYEEISLQLDRSLSNVKSDLYRARRRLGRLLAERPARLKDVEE